MGLVIAGSFALAAWVYLIAGRGGFWREFLREPAHPRPPSPVEPLPGILAVVPARNEAAVVGRAIASLAGQRYGGRFHIMLVDDHSSDGTFETARAFAAADQLTVIGARPLPAGWTGKLWAIAEGIRQAPFEPDCLLLTDADIVHPPVSVAELAQRAVAGPRDLVSFMATLECRTPAERLLIPAFVFFFFLLYPPRWVRNPARATAGAAGGCVLIRNRALEQIGGIAAIRGAWIDDCTLAAAVKRSGGRIWLGLSPGLQSVRGYGGFGETGRMISRSAFTQLRHSSLLLAGTVAGLVVTYWLPPVFTICAPQPVAGMAALAWLMMSVCYLPALRYYRQPWFLAPLLPLVSVFYVSATVHSAVSYWVGRGGQWKGRVQDRPI